MKPRQCAMDFQDLNKETLEYENKRRCPNPAMEGSPWCLDCALAIENTRIRLEYEEQQIRERALAKFKGVVHDEPIR